MKLIIAEKPSVARSMSKVLKDTSWKDGYTEGNGNVIGIEFFLEPHYIFPQQNK